MESQFLPASKISGTMYKKNIVVSVKCMMWKACRSPTLIIWKQLLISNARNGVRWLVLGFLQVGPAPVCLKISAWIAERETYRMLPLSTQLFSHWSIVNTLNLKIAFVAGPAWKILLPVLHKYAGKFIEKSASFMKICKQSFARLLSQVR